MKTDRQHKFFDVFSFIGTLLLCLSASLSLSMQFQQPAFPPDVPLSTPLLNIIQNFRYSCEGTFFSSSILFAAFLACGLYTRRKKKKHYRILPVLCFMIALVWLMAQSFRLDDTLNSLYLSAGQKVKSVCYLAGITYLLTQAGILTDLFFDSKWDLRAREEKLTRLYRRHPFFVPLIALLLCWSWQLFLSYPGSLCIDASTQLMQYFELEPFTAHHPPAHTCLIGFFVNLGKKLGSGNLGLFLFVTFQTVLLALVLAYMFDLMRQLSAPRWLRALFFGIAAFSPYYTEYFTLVVKDNLYSYAIVLFVIELIYILRLKNAYWTSPGHILLLGVSIIGSVLFRNNGAYVIYPTVFVLICLLLRNLCRKQLSAKTLGKALFALLIPIVMANSFHIYLMHHYNIRENSIRNALSLPFQQTARYVKEYPEEVTRQERKAINKVLDYDVLAEKYNPKISDPVKATFRNKATLSDLFRYLQVWLAQGIKHPGVYVQATVNQNYYLLYPMIENNTFYDITVYPDRPRYQVLYEETGIHEVEWISRMDDTRTAFNKLLFSFPVAGLLTNIAIVNILLLFVFYYVLRQKNYLFFVPALPLILSNIIIVLAPVIQGHPRYAFPILYTVPVLLAYYFNIRNSSAQR